MDNTGKALIAVCVGFGIMIGMEATKLFYDHFIIPSKLKNTKKEEPVNS